MNGEVQRGDAPDVVEDDAEGPLRVLAAAVAGASGLVRQRFVRVQFLRGVPRRIRLCVARTRGRVVGHRREGHEHGRMREVHLPAVVPSSSLFAAGCLPSSHHLPAAQFQQGRGAAVLQREQ